MNTIYVEIKNGKLILTGKSVELTDITWCNNPSTKETELKFDNCVFEIKG